MRFRLQLAGVLTALAINGGLAAAQTPSLNDLVLASVNGEEITRRQLVTRLVEYRGEEALDKMISRVLLQQEARKMGVTVTDADVEDRLKDLKRKFRSEADFRTFLERNGLNEKRIVDEMRNTLLIQRVALKASPITDVDLQEYDASLLIAPDKATAEKWVGELAAGADFKKLAAERNEDKALRGTAGHLAPFLKSEMLDVANAIEAQRLLPGTYTKTPVSLNGKWAIIRLETRIQVSQAAASQRDRLAAAVTEWKVDQWLTQTREKAARNIQRRGLDAPVVATVNGEPITRGQLVSRLLQYQGDETLQLMTNRAMLLQAARTQKVEVTPAEAEKRFTATRAQFPDETAFRAFLTRSNLSEQQFRDEIRFQVLMEKVALHENPVTDDDLTQYEVRMMVAPDQKEAQSWVKELDAGADFAAMAATRSLDPDGRNTGGKMKPFIRVEMLDIWRVVNDAKLKPGAYTKTPVLLTDNSWVLVKLERTIPVSTVTTAEHDRLAAIVTRYRVEQWLVQARQKAKIAFPTAIAGRVVEDAGG